MKIGIDKDVITLSDLAEAKQLRNDWKETLTDESILESFACRAARAVMPHTSKLVKVNSLEVTKNHYALTIWAEVILQSIDKFAITSFDILQANELEGGIDNYTRIFELKK